MDKIRIAVAGNPNVGKSTLFNILTGVRQHTGNYPGVTVERKEGTVTHGDHELQILDLPGIYSMNAFSPEETVARDFIINENPDLVVNIIDASQLEKNLYLTLQLLEMRVPVVIFLNMVDIAETEGIKVSAEEVSRILGVPVVIGSAKRKEGITTLLNTIVDVYKKHAPCPGIEYSSIMEEFVCRIRAVLAKHSVESSQGWIAVKLMEGDSQIGTMFPEEFYSHLLDHMKEIEVDVKKSYHSDSAAAVVKERYAVISKVTSSAVRRVGDVKESFSRKIDKLVIHRYLALPFFFLLMFILFQIVFTLGQPLMDLLEMAFGSLGEWVGSFWAPGSESMLRSLIVDGIIGGVGGVLVFSPNIFLMFLGIAFLEDSGYMARVAVIMDSYMSKIGLSGKSFVPMVLGFGCSVPAVMGARIVENKWERLTTILITPFMSCGARLPVYLLLISAFISKEYQAITLWIVYMTGIFFALIAAKFLRSKMLKGEKNPLIIELPHYAMPPVKTLLMLTWERGKHFIEKAGTIILAVSILLWVATTFPRYEAPADQKIEPARIELLQAENSVMGRIGKGLEPAVSLMGGDWRIGSSFVASLAAKEVFVSQMGILFSLGDVGEDDPSLQQKLKENYTLPAALAFILFMLLSAPCMATFAMVRAETRSWKWPIFQFFAMTTLAFVMAVIVYQIGSLFG